MRQPKIYVKLPSDGLFWEENSINIPENKEFPVYSMTAKDELILKTPDALMNGQAVVNVIQSCMPNITNAWDCPGIDLDLILVAIRIATYGEKMTVSHQVPNTQDTVDHEINLVVIMDQLVSSNKWNEIVVVGPDITCYVRPLTYKHMSEVNIKTFESQKTIQSIMSSEISDQERLDIFNRSMDQLSALAVEMVAESVFTIKTPTGLVQNQDFIREFIYNADAALIQQIQDHLNKNKETIGIKPIKFFANEEQMLAGAPESYEIPINMDNSNFFVRGS
jgi:hypothetical protein